MYMKRKFWKFISTLALATVVFLAIGMLDKDEWLYASNGEDGVVNDPITTGSEPQQESTIQTVDIPYETVEESTEATMESTEATTEITEAPEETTEVPSSEENSPEPTEVDRAQDEPELVIVPVGYDGIYDGMSHKASCSISIPEDTIITYSIDNGVTWSADAPEIKNVGEVAFLVKAENPNYKTAVSAMGVLKVSPATITITTAGAQRTYNGSALYATGITVTGLVNGETLQCHATGSRIDVGQSKNVYLINWFDSTAKFNNYTIVNDYGILEVAPAVLTVTTYSAEKLFDGTPLTAGGMVTGFVWGENATLVITGSQTEAGESDNTYDLIFDGTAKEGNYIINENIGTLKIVSP